MSGTAERGKLDGNSGQSRKEKTMREAADLAENMVTRQKVGDYGVPETRCERVVAPRGKKGCGRMRETRNGVHIRFGMSIFSVGFL